MILYETYINTGHVKSHIMGIQCIDFEFLFTKLMSKIPYPFHPLSRGRGGTGGEAD